RRRLDRRPPGPCGRGRLLAAALRAGHAAQQPLRRVRPPARALRRPDPRGRHRGALEAHAGLRRGGVLGLTPFLARVYVFKFFDAFILIFPLYAVMFVQAVLSPTQISIALIAWSATTFVLQAPSGVIADRYPRKWVLAAAQVARGAGFAIWWIAPHFWGFVIGLSLWGVKSAFTNGTF